MNWTDDRVSLLRKLWGEGRTAAEIAKELGGVTRNAVIGKAHRLKLSNRISPIQQNKKPIIKTQVEQKTPLQDNNKVAPVHVFAIVEKPEQKHKDEKTIVDKKSELISLLDLKPRMCRWPVGDPRDRNFGFCGCESVSGLPYCAEHSKLAYQVPSRQRPIQADKITAKYDAADETFVEKEHARLVG